MSASNSGHEENEDRVIQESTVRGSPAQLQGCQEHILRDNSSIGLGRDEALKPRMTTVSPIKAREQQE